MKTSILSLRLVCTVAGLSAICSIGLASGNDNNELTLGGSRAAGMGGAGLALPIQAYQNHDLNPAFLGMNASRFDFYFPSFGYRLHGLSTSQLKDFSGNVSSGGIDQNNLVKYAKALGSHNTQFGLLGSVGVGVGRFAIDGMADASVTAVPNATLQGYAGGAGGIPPAGARLDSYGLGYYSYGLSYGTSATVTEGQVAAGIAARGVTAYYSHERVQFAGAGGFVSGPGGEMGGKDTINKKGFALDLGTLIAPSSAPNHYFGIVVKNLIPPQAVAFDRQIAGADGNPVLARNVDVFRTQFNVGYGQVCGGTLLAADVLDLGNNAGQAQLAVGVEHAFNHFLAVRAGYNSRTNFTVGVSVLGINLAYGPSLPVTATTSFRF